MIWDSLGLIAATGIISAVWTSFWTWGADFLQRRNRATHTVLRTVIVLEEYAVRCWDVAYTGHEHFRETGDAYSSKVPVLEGLPENASWIDVDPSIADDIFSLSNAISVAQVKAGFATRHENNPFEADGYALEFGREAWLLAKRLRERYRLPGNQRLESDLKELLRESSSSIGA